MLNLLLGNPDVVIQIPFALATRSRWIRRGVRRNSTVALLLAFLPLVACSAGNDAASDADASSITEDAVADNVMSSQGVLPSDSVWLGNAWMRAGAAGATTGAYAVIYNTRNQSVSVAGATSNVADTVEVHESMMHGGMVHMEPQLSLSIPAADSVVLAPGGKHFMVRALQRSLSAGDTVTVRVLLSDGTVIDVPFAVRAIGG